MKRSHIIGILVIALAIGAIISTLSDSGTYTTFKEAFNHPGKEFHVVGVLDRSEPSTYNPQLDADIFSFWMIDKNGDKRKVVLHKSQPQDFERSEQIVIIGSAKGEEFHASDILLKCPSKYAGDQQVIPDNAPLE
ncbi:MAG: cytochrome c maturation protein CcmE [Flavobacteriales bacterium]